MGGHYRVALPLTGGITSSIAANSPLVAFRWAPTTAGLLAIIKKITANASVHTTGSSAAIIAAMDVIRATAFTVQDSAGTAVTFNLTQKQRSSMGNSQAAIQYASSTVALTAGTRTLDGSAFGAILIDEWPQAALPRSPAVPPLFSEDSQGVHPLVLANNEGFIVRNIAAWTSTSLVVDVFVSIEWAEALQY